jgi:hypothetical protein
VTKTTETFSIKIMKQCGKMKRSATLILIISHRFLAEPIAPQPQQQCWNNPACVTLKFEGSCCPTDDFRWLDCCSEKNETHTNQKDEGISVKRSLLSAQCSQYSGCAHLANDCCPTTSDGVMLVSSQTQDSDCSSHSEFIHLFP